MYSSSLRDKYAASGMAPSVPVQDIEIEAVYSAIPVLDDEFDFPGCESDIIEDELHDVLANREDLAA